MKLKAALVLTMLVFASLISLSNKCKTQCDGRVVVKAPVVIQAAQQAEDDKEASERELAGSSPLLRMAITM